MRFKKGQSGNPKGKPKGCKNKPAPFMERLREAFGTHIKDTDLEKLVTRALAHACGDTIITESADGEKLTAKVVSDPRLLLGLGGFVAKAEERRPAGAPMPILDGLRKELEGYSKPSDTATA